MSKYRVLLTRLAGGAIPVSSIALHRDMIKDSMPSSTADEAVPEGEEVAPDISKIIRSLRVSQPTRLSIPLASRPDTVTSMHDQVFYQRTARLGGSLVYPLMSLMTTNIPLAMGLIGYMPFCVVLHHLSAKRATQSVAELIENDKLLPNEADNRALKEWIQAKGIDSVSFNTKGDLVLFKGKELSILADNLTCLDSSPLKINSEKPIFSPWSREDVPYIFRSVTINFYHLNKDVQEQVARVMQERSKRFRGPLMFGAAAYSLSFLSTIFVGLRGAALLTGMMLGAYSSNAEVREETDALKRLIIQKGSLDEIVAPEFLDTYAALRDKKEVGLVVNIFGDIVLDPEFPTRQVMDITFGEQEEKHRLPAPGIKQG